ncbi:MAG TPA: M13 family metallopeptidase, partial [Haliangiales bacterium]|nr:M13 family metallopeptidase [Haliangiales bacterium]
MTVRNHRTRPAFAAWVVVWATACAHPVPSRPVAAADFLARAVDASVDPRRSFYDYATGGYRRGLAIPGDRAAVGFMTQIHDALADRLFALLDELPAAGDHDAQVLRDLWRSGLLAEHAPAAEVAAVGPRLAAIDAVTDVAGLFDEVARLRRISVAAAFDIGVGTDDKERGRQLLWMLQGGLGLPDRSFYLLTDPASIAARAAYERYLHDSFVLLGDTPERARREAAAVVALEHALAEASLPFQDWDVAHSFARHSLAELAALAPSVDWARFHDRLGAPGVASIATYHTAYFRQVERLLHERSLDDWKAYLRARLVQAFAPYLGSELRAAHFRCFDQALRGVEVRRPWRNVVLRAINADAGDLLGRRYVARHVPPRLVAQVRDMAEHIKATYRDRLAASTWMSEPTRRVALEKLDRLRFMLVEPEVHLSFDALHASPVDFVGNLLAARELGFDRELAKLAAPTDPRDWQGVHAQDWMATYSVGRNAFLLTAGFLYLPGFDPDDPDPAYLYGIIGATIGHEITHAFDSVGRLFDERGVSRDWWTEADARKFEDMSGVLVGQFNAYAVAPALHIDGARNLPENLAEIGGATIAFDAFRATPAFAAGRR